MKPTNLQKKICELIKSQAMRLKKIYEAPNPEVDAIVESLRKEVEIEKRKNMVNRKKLIKEIKELNPIRKAEEVYDMGYIDAMCKIGIVLAEKSVPMFEILRLIKEAKKIEL